MADPTFDPSAPTEDYDPSKHSGTPAFDPAQASTDYGVSPPPPPESPLVRSLFGEDAARWTQQNIQDPLAYLGREVGRQFGDNRLAYGIGAVGDPTMGIPGAPPDAYPKSLSDWKAQKPAPEPERGGAIGYVAAPLKAFTGEMAPINLIAPGSGFVASEAGEAVRQAGGTPKQQAEAEMLGGLSTGLVKAGIERVASSPWGIARSLESDAGLPAGGAARIAPSDPGTTRQAVTDAWNKHLNTIMNGGTVDPNSLRYTTGLLAAPDEATFVQQALSDPARLRAELPQVADHIGARTVGNVSPRNPGPWTGLPQDARRAIVPDAGQRAALDRIAAPPGPIARQVGKAATGAAAYGVASQLHNIGLPHFLTPELIELGAGALGYGSHVGSGVVAQGIHDVVGGVRPGTMLQIPGRAAQGYFNWQEGGQRNEP